MIAGKCQFIPTASARALDRGDVFLAGFCFGHFHGIAGLVSEFTKVHLVGMGRARQHADIRAGAKYLVFARLQHHNLDFGMFKSHPLNNISKFDINAEII